MESLCGLALPARPSHLERPDGDENGLYGKCAGLSAFWIKSRRADRGWSPDDPASGQNAIN